MDAVLRRRASELVRVQARGIESPQRRTTREKLSPTLSLYISLSLSNTQTYTRTYAPRQTHAHARAQIDSHPRCFLPKSHEAQDRVHPVHHAELPLIKVARFVLGAGDTLVEEGIREPTPSTSRMARERVAFSPSAENTRGELGCFSVSLTSRQADAQKVYRETTRPLTPYESCNRVP